MMFPRGSARRQNSQIALLDRERIRVRSREGRGFVPSHASSRLLPSATDRQRLRAVIYSTFDARVGPTPRLALPDNAISARPLFPAGIRACDHTRVTVFVPAGKRTARPVVGRPSILFDTRRNALPRAAPANGPRHRRDRRSSRPLCSSCLERRYLRIVVGSQLEFPAEGSGGLERRESSDSLESRSVRCEATSRSRSFPFKHEDESLRHAAAGVFLAHGIRTQRRGNYTVTKIPARHTQQDNFYPRPPQKSRAQFVRLLLSIARRMRLRKLKRGKALAPAYAPGQKINKGGARAASGRAAPRRCNAPAYPRAPELRARSSQVARIAPAARARAREKRARRLAVSKTRFLPGNVTEPDVLVRDTTRARSSIANGIARTHARGKVLTGGS